MGIVKPSVSWSFLRDNSRLRGVIKYKLEEKDLYLKDIERTLGIRQDALSKYLRAAKPSITEFDLLRLADYLGVEITLDIKLKP